MKLKCDLKFLSHGKVGTGYHLSTERIRVADARTMTERHKENFQEAAVSLLDHLYRVAFHLTRERADAEDLVQETYLKAVIHYGQFTPGTNLKGWLVKILYNLFITRYHRNKRMVSLDQGGVETESSWVESVQGIEPGPEAELLRTELQDKLREALDTLPEEFSTTIVLVDIGGFSYAEVAGILSCPIGTVRSRLFRARNLLAGKLRAYVRQER